jgi:integrase
MANNKLTDAKLKTLRAGPAGKAKYYADGGCLYVTVRGVRGHESRSFGFRGTLKGQGQLPMISIGPYPKVSLTEARDERDRCHKLIREGKDPRQVRANERAKPAGPPPTVNRLLKLYFEKKVEPKRRFDTEAKRRDRCVKEGRHLERISKAIGKMSVASVSTEDLLEKVGLDELSRTHPPTAWDLRRILRKAFGMAVALKWIDSNPASDEILNALLTTEYYKSTPNPAVDYVDAPRFIAEVKAYKNPGRGMSECPLATVPALLFLVYTGVRTQEVREAQWREIKWKTLLWVVPPGHRKNGEKKGKDRAIPISKPMLAVLKEMQRRYPDATPDDLIFRGGSRNGCLAKGSINGFIKNSLRFRSQQGDAVHINPHGFRATLKAWARAQRPPYHPFFVERQFDHIVRGVENDSRGVEGYDDHDRANMSDSSLEGPGARREMTENYGTYLESYQGAEMVPPADTQAA